MLPVAIASLIVFPIYHIANLLGGKDLLRRMINSDSHFEQYRPEEKERILEVFASRGANVTVDEDTKKNILDKANQVKDLFSEYCTNRKEGLDKILKERPDLQAQGIQDKISNHTSRQYQSAKKRLDEDINVFSSLINDMGKAPHRYGPSDILSRVHRIKQRVNDALEEQFKLEVESVKEDPKLVEALKNQQQEQKKAIMKPMDETVDTMHKAAQLQADQEFMAMQQWAVLEYIKSKANNEEQELASIKSTIDGTKLCMDNLDIHNAPALIDQYNEKANLSGDDRLAFTAKNGQRLNVKKTGDSYSIEYDLPRRLFSPFYYCSPYSNIKSATQDAISIYIASGHISKGGVLRLYVKFDDDKSAIEAAREQYLAAIESGLKPGDPKQFYMEINGTKYSDEDILKKCFSRKDDQARLNKAKGIAERTASAAEKKWSKIKEDYTAYEHSPVKNAETAGNWNQENKAYAHYKKLKSEHIDEQRQKERHEEHEEWKEQPNVQAGN